MCRWLAYSGGHRLLAEVAAPEIERALEVPLRGRPVVDGQVGHREPVLDARQSLHHASDAVRLELRAKPVDVLGGDGSVDLGEREVELAAHAFECVVR